MRWYGKNANTLLLALAGVLPWSGCSQVQLPAIDPSGQRIFLPAPASTTLLGPDCVPRPVFPTPAPVPPCPPGFSADALQPSIAPPPAAVVMPPTATPPAVVVPATPAVAPLGGGPLGGGLAQQLTLSPARLIAPVGTEVVLLSGLIGDLGQAQAGQLIQWSLSRESVGNFLEVNRDDSWLCSKILHKKTTELTSDFATSRSLGATQVITRGTLATDDDVTVPAGYSWLSLTSSSEGTSFVSVSAPSAASWNRRRQTATVHWVDVQWTLPSPAAGPAGTPLHLTTILNRGTTGEPLANWIVRYRLSDPSIAWLGAEGQTEVEVPTALDGQASIEVLPQQVASSATTVQVEIVRPASAAGNVPRLVVGQAWASIAWSAPGLNVSMVGPPTLTSNSVATYRVTVSNTGDRPASNVVVSDVLPGALELLNSEPPHSTFGERMQWDLGNLEPGATREIVINCRARVDASLRHCVQVRCDEGAQAEACVTTNIFTPSLSLNVNGPQTAEIGQTIDYLIEVTNTGPAPLADVLLYDEFDAGLEQVEGHPSPIDRPLGNLQPRESRRIKVSFRVTRQGTLCHSLRVTATGGHSATARRCVEVIAPASPPAVQQPPPQANYTVQIRKTGPNQRKVGQIAEYTIVVTNTGDTRLTGLRIADSYEATLQPKAATEGYAKVNGELVWDVASLDPGQEVRRQVNCLCLEADRGAQNRASVTTDQQVGSVDEITTQIIADPQDTTTNANVPPAQSLIVGLVDTVDPLTRGDDTTYLLRIENGLDVEHTKVTVTIFVPEGMSFQRITAPVGTASLNGGRKIVLEPINVLRAKEKLPDIRIIVRGDQPGTYQFRVQVDSLRLDQPLEKMVETQVIGP